MVAKHPATGLLPMLILIVPAVSEPLTLVEPPEPTAGPCVRPGVPPPIIM